MGSATNGCRVGATYPHRACGCTCVVTPSGDLATGENGEVTGGLDNREGGLNARRRQKAAVACAPLSGLRKQKRAEKGQYPTAASSVHAQRCCESDSSHPREMKTSPPGGVLDGGSYTVEGATGYPLCERCAAAAGGLGVAEGQGNTASRHFVSLWSEVQCAVWHVNACLGVLGLVAERGGSGDGDGGNIGGGVILDPMRLRPALALECFKGKSPRLVESRHLFDSSEASGVVGQRQAASHTVRKGLKVPRQGGSRAAAAAAAATTAAVAGEEAVQMAKSSTYGTSPPAGPRAATAAAEAEGAANTTKRRTHARRARGWGNLETDDKQQPARGLHGGCTGVWRWEQPERLGGKEPHIPPPGKQGGAVSRGVVEGCGGDCPWARRVRTVLGAAGSVHSR